MPEEREQQAYTEGIAIWVAVLVVSLVGEVGGDYAPGTPMHLGPYAPGPLEQQETPRTAERGQTPGPPEAGYCSAWPLVLELVLRWHLPSLELRAWAPGWPRAPGMWGWVRKAARATQTLAAIVSAGG